MSLNQNRGHLACNSVGDDEDEDADGAQEE